MARYKDVNYHQDKLIPISFHKQILPGTFEYTLSYLIDHELDLSVFDSRYHNDETGAPAFDPAVLLKIVIYAYSRGITSSRKIEQACRENIIFMALSADTQPHFTTIADFISQMDEQIVPLFRNVLLMCYELKMVGAEMFAIDGCKRKRPFQAVISLRLNISNLLSIENVHTTMESTMTTTRTLTQPRRVRRSKDEWRQVFARFEHSGQTIEQFCAQQGLALSTFNRWRQRLRTDCREAVQDSPEAVFVELSRDNAPCADVSPWDVELQLGNGMFLRLRQSSC